MNSVYARRVVRLLPWISTIPKNWNLLRSKFLFEAVDIRSDDGTEELLTVSSAYGVIPRKHVNVTMFEAVSYEGYKLCWPGDLVINSLWAWAYALGISQYHGIVSTAYGVYRVIPKVKADLRYLHWLLRSVPFQWELQTRSKGIWISRLQLTDEAFLSAPILFPPYKEQLTISKYLEHADQMLRGGVSQKKRLVDLMEEYKRAVIQQAVTRGLDPDVPLKPSGVEWLGDIPEHWKVRRLKDWVSINETVLSETTDPNYKFNYIDIGSAVTGKLLSDPVILNFGDAPSRARRVIKTGDTIFSTVRTYLKAVWFAELVNSELICSTGFAVLTPKKDAVGKFVSYLVQSTSFTDVVTSESVGIAYPAIAEGSLGSFYVPVPPVEEQAAIVAHLDKLTSDIDAAIAHTRREIELLEEYRTRLIADVVTGKLDVREAAANLPNIDLADTQLPNENDATID